MREARNAAAFQAWIKAETGWNLEIISGLEEGRLIHHGVVAGEPAATGRVLLIDLGGGSCEITVSERKRIKETVSLPLGAVRLTQQFLPEDPPSPEGLGQMRQLISRELRRARRRVRPDDIAHVIATSGTAAALADACAALARPAKPARRAVGKEGHGMAQAIARAGVAAGIAPTALVRKLASRMEKMPLPEREAIPGIGPRRAEIIIAGSHVFSEILESFSLPGFRYSPCGLRDGLLAQMLAESDTRASGHREFEKERWESVLATAHRYGIDTRHADPVREHAQQLFRELRPLHNLPPEYENWLVAAAVLRDTGKFINHQGHHRHSQYIISSSEMYGYTPVQRTIVSAIARYLGKTRPQPSDRAMRNIPAEQHKDVMRAVVLLRLAVALNQDRASDVLRVAARVYPKRIYIDIKPGRTGAELELWSLRKEADYFREVFGRELFPTLS
jgi:exopolyphosphatase/guanosine-5'-triphosphate,3'-diphosphate pyrophosphatase